MSPVLLMKIAARKDFELTLDGIAREGARRMLVRALDLEVAVCIERFKDEVDDDGRRLVVRNGKSRARSVTMSSGAVQIESPRVNDRREGAKFFSSLPPPYLRKSPKVESFLPVLYLKGLSTGDFKFTLVEFLG